MNKLYYGDCLTIMLDMPLGSVDLIYLDPPFNSNRDYNALYKDETGRPLPDQIEAFCDLWTLDEERERAIRHMPILMRDAGVDDAVAEFWKIWCNALRKTQPGLLAYLSYMTERLLPMRGILKPTGSLYLHCDPTASHYIKIMLDGIFGHDSFKSEIVWKRTNSHNFRTKKFGSVHDIILYYSRSKKPHFNIQYTEYGPEQRSRFKKDSDGRLYKPENLTFSTPNPNRQFTWRGTTPAKHRSWGKSLDELEKMWEGGLILKKKDGSPRLDGWKVFIDDTKGKPVDSVWVDIPRIANTSSERLGYATQKPITLLDRIIATSTNPGDVVFDPFCGCATTLESAHRLKRRWIGIDIAIHAIKKVAKARLEDRLGLTEGVDFTIEGVPHTLEGACDLWERDKYHFQKWAVEQVDGFVTTRRTGDGGIDGRLYFAIPQQSATERDPLRSMVIEVKGGHNVGVGVVRDLRGVLERDEAEMAGLIVMHDPGDRKRASFGREMAAAGDLDVMGMPYPRMQLLTVAEILEGKRFKTPGAVGRGAAQSALPLG